LFSYGATPPVDGRPTSGTPASIEHDYQAIRGHLEEYGVIAYRPGSEAEMARLAELRAENNALRTRVAELEGRSE
jgi:hypothetical protein